MAGGHWAGNDRDRSLPLTVKVKNMLKLSLAIPFFSAFIPEKLSVER
jgi:hypothetical protein